MNWQRAVVPAALGGLLGWGIVFALAWSNGLGECNVTTAPHDDSTGLLRVAVAIAAADLALCVGVWRPLRDTDKRPWILLIGSASAVLCAVALALLAGLNFRGC
jgi:hypothetical protein